MYDYGVQPHPPTYKLLKGGEELAYDYGVQPHPPTYKLLKGGEELVYVYGHIHQPINSSREGRRWCMTMATSTNL